MKLFDKEKTLLIADYIKTTYEDDTAHQKLQAFLAGVDVGWREAIAHAAQYVNDWHEPMCSYGDGTVKGILNEVEGGIRELEFGDV
ncbi:hypothetical protein D3C87_324500 [compost metagenome]